jgi:hypothetical protein
VTSSHRSVSMANGWWFDNIAEEITLKHCAAHRNDTTSHPNKGSDTT